MISYTSHIVKRMMTIRWIDRHRSSRCYRWFGSRRQHPHLSHQDLPSGGVRASTPSCALSLCLSVTNTTFPSTRDYCSRHGLQCHPGDDVLQPSPTGVGAHDASKRSPYSRHFKWMIAPTSPRCSRWDSCAISVISARALMPFYNSTFTVLESFHQTLLTSLPRPSSAEQTCPAYSRR